MIPETSDRIAAVAALLGLAVLVAAVLVLADAMTSPVLPPVDSAPIPASTAGPSPISAVLTAEPLTGWGPR